SLLNILRLRKNFSHVVFQQAFVCGVNQCFAYRFLSFAQQAEAAGPFGPQIVILAHPVVEPANVIRMFERVGGGTDRDEFVDFGAGASHSDIDQTRGLVGGALASESILWSGKNFGGVSCLL